LPVLEGITVIVRDPSNVAWLRRAPDDSRDGTNEADDVIFPQTGFASLEIIDHFAVYIDGNAAIHNGCTPDISHCVIDYDELPGELAGKGMRDLPNLYADGNMKSPVRLFPPESIRPGGVRVCTLKRFRSHCGHSLKPRKREEAKTGCPQRRTSRHKCI